MTVAACLLDVVFVGEVAPGEQPEDVRARLGEMFHLEDGRLAALFSGQPMVVKRGVDEATAERLVEAFARAGAVARIQESHQEPVPATPEKAKPPQLPGKPAAADGEMTCPKCGFIQPAGDSCLRCGVLVQRFLARARQGLNIEQLVREGVAQLASLGLNRDRFCFAPEIPEAKLRNALEPYTNGKVVWKDNHPVELDASEEILLLYDNSGTLNGKSHLLLTNRHLFYCMGMITPVCWGVAWNQIQSFTLDSSTDFSINGQKGYFLTPGGPNGAAELRQFQDFFSRVAHTLRQAGQAKVPLCAPPPLPADPHPSPAEAPPAAPPCDPPPVAPIPLSSMTGGFAALDRGSAMGDDGWSGGPPAAPIPTPEPSLRTGDPGPISVAALSHVASIPLASVPPPPPASPAATGGPGLGLAPRSLAPPLPPPIPLPGEPAGPLTVGQAMAPNRTDLVKQACEKERYSGFFGAEKRGIDKGVLGGLVMMGIAAAWFFLGLKANRIFFYPPVLFLMGLYAFFKGLMTGNMSGE